MANESNSIGQIGIDLVVNSNEFQKQMGSIQGMARKAGAALAGAFATKKLVDFGKKCLDLGSDLQEVQNVVDVTFPRMSAKVDEFAKSAASSFGLSETMAKQYTGTFGAMAKAFGFTEGQAYDMGTTLTGLAGDVASFYNLSQDEAYTKLKSVFTGETESLKDLGVVMTQTALDAYAMANGFGKTTAAMTEQEKVALRYSFVQNKLTAAQGDFARTSDSWANQCKILALQAESAMAAIGQGLINLFTPVIKLMNTVLGKVVTLANAFKAFTDMLTGGKGSSAATVAEPVQSVSDAAGAASSGLENASGAADNLAGSTNKAGKAAQKAAKQMRSLMGFDKVNRVSSQKSETSGNGSGAGVSGGAGGIGSAVDFGSIPQGETAIGKLDGRLQALIDRANQLAALFRKGFRIGFGDSEKKIRSITESIKGIGTSLRNIFTDPGVVASANHMLDSIALSLGKITGSAASIGLSLGANLFGGVNNYLSQNGDYIKGNIVSVLDAVSEVWNLAGEYATAVSSIFDVFATPEAQQCTADLIGIFSDGFLGVVGLGAKFVADVANTVVVPVKDNVDKIRLAFEGIISPIGTVLGTLHQSVQNTFGAVGRMYDEHIAPMLASFTQGLSSLTGTVLDAWNTYISPVLDSISQKFTVVWVEHIQPMINSAIQLVGQIADLIRVLWEEWLEPLEEWIVKTLAPIVGKILEDIGMWLLELMGTAGDAVNGILTALGGLVEFFTGVFSGDWNKATSGLKKTTEGLKKAVSGAFEYIKTKTLEPFNTFLSDVFETNWEESFGAVGAVMNDVFGVIEKGWKDAKELFNDILEFIRDVFTGKWESAWQTCSDAFDRIFGGLVDLLKMPINGVIALLNGVIGTINSLLATIESHLKFDFTIPNPLSDGNLVDYHWSATLPRIDYTIPPLAKGGYVKPNTPQLAMIGDNRHQGEVVAPEDKLQAMVDEAVRRSSGNGGVTREELERLLNNVVARIVSALAAVGFNLDGEQLATLQRMSQTSIDRRYNTVAIS